MRLFRFDASAGRTIEQFGSAHLTLSPIQRTTTPVQIACMHLGPAGVVGYHQATCPQLFLVVQGEGWVRSETSDRRSIYAGQAAYWETNEWHEAGSADGMTVIVIEADALDPGQFMREEAP